MLDVAHDGVHVRAAEKRRVEVQPDHAAAVADGAEEVVGEVARVRAHGAAVRVRSDHRAEPEAHRVPRRRLRQVRHVRQHPVGIQRAHKVAPLCRESLRRRVAVRAGEGVCVVPRQRHIHALPCRRLIQPFGVAVEQLRALDAEQRSRFSGCPCRAHVPRRAAAAHKVGIARTFALEQGVLPLRSSVERLVYRCAVGKDRKDLRVPAERRAAREVNVAGVLPQPAAALKTARERVTVPVKAAQHQASSRRVTASR